MKKHMAAVLIALVAFGITFPQMNANAAPSVKTEQLAQNHLSIEQAKSQALQQVHGKVVNIGLNNHGGTLVYRVTIEKSGQTFQVAVGADSGKVLHIAKQMRHPH